MPEPLDPELEALIEALSAQPLPAWNELSVPAARRLEDELFSGDETPAVGSVRDLAFDGPHGEVPVRAYRPSEPSGRLLVVLHGGGWVLGTLDSIDGICRELATRGDATVVSVDYRLAPEHEFPVAVDESVAAVSWAARNAADLGADADRIGVVGSSAGGGLAAAAALYAREFDAVPGSATRTVPAIAGQFLLYPVLGGSFDAASDAETADGPLLTRADMEWFWDRYLRSPVDAHNPFAAPLRADDLSGLPPATVVTAGHDPLRDEGRAYADRLADADVDVERRHYPSMCHGFLSLTDQVGAADRAMDELAADVRSVL